MQDIHGQTPLFVPSQRGAGEVCRLLVNSGADPSIKTKDGSSPLVVAAPSVANILKDKQLLCKPDVDIETQILEAAKNGELEILKVCLLCVYFINWGGLCEGKTWGNSKLQVYHNHSQLLYDIRDIRIAINDIHLCGTTIVACFCSYSFFFF